MSHDLHLAHDDHDGAGPHQHDLGLAYDLGTVMHRRRALKFFAGAGLVTLASCASAKSALSGGTTTTTAAGSTAGSTATTAASVATSGSAVTSAATAASSAASTAATTGSSAATTAAAASTSALAADLSAIPEETAGPYPGDGSNGPNALAQSGIVRSDITSSFGSSTTKAAGVPTTIRLQIVKAGNGAPVAGAAVYLWHCDQQGRYSMYSQGVTNENFLRGVQVADADGFVSFQTIYPGCYSGRWPHVHYEVYPSIDVATKASAKVATSQLALPGDVSTAVYATDGYSASVRNAATITLASDNVFRDGAERETPSASGNVTDGFVLKLGVPVKV